MPPRLANRRILEEMRVAACALLAALVVVPVAGAAHADSPAATKRVVRTWSTHLNAYDTQRMMAPVALRFTA